MFSKWTSLSAETRKSGSLLVLALVAAWASSLPVMAAAPQASMLLSDTALPPLHLKSHKISIQIHGRVAQVTTDSVYHNETHQQLEATFVFPVPEGAAVDRFTLWMNNEPIEAKIAEKGVARRIYENIVARKNDPGLLEQVNQTTFKYRIFPVPANGDQRLRLTYSQVLPLATSGDEINLVYPLAMNQTSIRCKSFVLTADLEMENSIAAITSPTHALSCRIDPKNDYRAHLSIEESFKALDKDFHATIRMKKQVAQVAALCFRDPDADQEKGTLMLLLTPRAPEDNKLPPRDVVFVVDTSGSMEGIKIEQARLALLAGLDRLREQDRFAIIGFAGTAQWFKDDWCIADKNNLERARGFVQGLEAGGATNIEDALRQALSYPAQQGRVRQILFATDGLPTAGTDNTTELLALIKNKESKSDQPSEARFFTFGVGYDVNTRLLDLMAFTTFGERRYVSPSEKIDQKVAELCDRVFAPILTDVSLSFSDELEIEEIYPNRLRDLYLGQQTVILARYRAPGKGDFIIRGRQGDRKIELKTPIRLPEKTGAATAYLPKQWAQRKVGFLLDQIRLNGECLELKNEVIRLSKMFGIVTPYTSYLALEPGERLAQDARDSTSRTIVTHEEVEIADHNETDDEMMLDVPLGGSGTVAELGLGGGGGGRFGRPSGAGGRRRRAIQGGGSSATESAVDAALQWLADHQSVDGSWQTLGDGGSPEGQARVNSWIYRDTALAILAFLGAGHTQKVGKFKQNVNRAVSWLIAQQDNSGYIGRKDDKDEIEKLQQHAIAGWALAEAAEMARVPNTVLAAKAALKWTSAFLKNGNPDQQLPIRTLARITLQLKSAMIAGLARDYSPFEIVLGRLESSKVAALTEARYSSKPQQKEASALATLQACLIRMHFGHGRVEWTEPSNWAIDANGLPDLTRAKTAEDIEYIYEGTVLAFETGGETWQNWNQALKRTMLASQVTHGAEKGSWPLPEEIRSTLGYTAVTALNCLSLEVYYRYLPIYRAGEQGPITTVQPLAPKATDQAPPVPNSDSGKDAVDYSEYIRRLKEGDE